MTPPRRFAAAASKFPCKRTSRTQTPSVDLALFIRARSQNRRAGRTNRAACIVPPDSCSVSSSSSACRFVSLACKAFRRQVFVGPAADLVEGRQEGTACIGQLVGDCERWTFVDGAADEAGLRERRKSCREHR